MNDLLAKPYLPEQLYAMIRKWCPVADSDAAPGEVIEQGEGYVPQHDPSLTLALSDGDAAMAAELLADFRDSLPEVQALLQSALAPEAILFDMDGVLADVSRSYREAILQTVAHYGPAITGADVAAETALGDANNDWVLSQRLLAKRGVDVDLEQVTVKPQADALANTPALLLGGSDTALEQFEYQGTTVEDEVTWVRLVPVSTESGFVRVELAFVEDQLRRMVFFDSLDQTTYVTLENVSVNEPVDAGRFVFTVPEDVDLVGKPAVAAPADE